MVTRPTLLTITPDFPPSVGGIQILLLRLLEELGGWDHRVVARGPSAAEGRGRFRDTRTRLRNGPLSLVELNGRALASGLRRRPDVLLNAHVVATPGALALSRRWQLPVVSYGYADELTHRPWLTSLMVRRSDTTIAISRYTKGLLDAHGPSVPIPVVAPGFDPIVCETRDRLRPTIVTVSRLVDRYKGHDVVLRAMPDIVRRVPDVEWVIVGDGPLRGELEEQASTLGVRQHVRFEGRVTDARRAQLIAGASVFVMPSRLPERGAGGEGFGIVYLEAASAGVPVVAGAVAGALDAVSDGVTGLLVDPTDSRAVADALVRILSTPEFARAMSDASLRWASTFSWVRMAAEVDAVLRESMERRGRASDTP